MNSLILVLNLLCTSPEYGMNIHVNVQVTDQKNYQVTLKDSRMVEMEMFRKELHFDELGSISEIEAHHWVENFNIAKMRTGGWEGLYQYDLAYYPIRCSEL